MNYEVKHGALRLFLTLNSIFLILIFSGCSLPGRNAVSNREPAPILLAQECGMDGLKCCDASPSCSYGQECCVNPADPSENMCADKCEFGKLEQFCTADSQCDQSLKCLNGRCAACGAAGEACCQGQKEIEKCNGKIKSGSLVCVNDKCLACGQPGNPCCGGDKCFKQDGLGLNRTECRQGNCVACGQNNQPTCESGNKCADNFMVNNERCLGCGQFNQPCCKNDSGQVFCDKKLKLKCELGFCN